MGLLDNPVLVITIPTWLLAETIKFVVRRQSDPKAKFGHPGGMPSGHATLTGSAATVIGLESGIESPLFGLAVVLVAIVIHDAVRLRWSVGEQAARINELAAVGKSTLPPLMVWRGHRIREVAVGIVFGGLVSAALYQWWFA